MCATCNFRSERCCVHDHNPWFCKQCNDYGGHGGGGQRPETLQRVRDQYDRARELSPEHDGFLGVRTDLLDEALQQNGCTGQTRFTDAPSAS